MTIPVLGTVLIVIAVVITSFGGVFSQQFAVEKLQSGGLTMSLQNHEEFWIKAFDQSVEIIAKRSAFELARTGGFQSSEPATWYKDYPTMEILESELEKKINRNLPVGNINAKRSIEFYNSIIDVSGYDTDCLVNSKSECFIVDGEKYFAISDKSIEAKMSLDPHTFSYKIGSNYFRLMKAGRIIMDEYNTEFDNVAGLLNTLRADSRFDGLHLETALVDGLIEFRISDRECVSSGKYFCLAPTKHDEYGAVLGGTRVPYDFLILKFRVDKENLYHD